MPGSSTSSRGCLTGVVQAHGDAFVAQQNLEILDSGAIGLEVFLSEAVAKAVRAKACAFESRAARHALNDLAHAVDGESMIATHSVRSTTEEESLGAYVLGSLVHRIFENGALRLWMKFYAAVFVTLAMHLDRTGHVVAFDHIGEA